jgi:phage baseplate assembly protein W
MPLPNLSTVCIDLKVTSQELCITFPGGAEMCVQIPGVPDPTDVSKQLLAQANAALAPLVPIFNIVDAIIALFNCVKAIPDSLGPPPDPTKLAECIPDLAKKIDQLLKLIPQLSIPVLIAGLIDVLLFYLQGFRGQLEAIIAHQARLLAAATRAAELGNVQLRTVVDCAERQHGRLPPEPERGDEAAEPARRPLEPVPPARGPAADPRLQEPRRRRRGRARTARPGHPAAPDRARGAPGMTMANPFLGRGLVHPFQRDRRSDFAAAERETLVRSAVGQVLATAASSDFTEGELPFRTEFGSLLHLLRHHRNDATLQELARVYVVDALKRWEPRVQVTRVQVTRERDRGENVLAIRLRYRIIDRNTPGNNVIVEGIEQVVLV